MFNRTNCGWMEERKVKIDREIKGWMDGRKEGMLDLQINRGVAWMEERKVRQIDRSRGDAWKKGR